MKLTRTTVAAIAVLLGIMASASALAHGGKRFHGRSGVSVGVVIGAPFLWHHYARPRYYYPAPVYYYPGPAYYYPPAAVAPAPPVYVERDDAYSPPAQAPGYWYYCPEAQAYYPYVKQCAGGWQRVTPQPPG